MDSEIGTPGLTASITRGQQSSQSHKTRHYKDMLVTGVHRWGTSTSRSGESYVSVVTSRSIETRRKWILAGRKLVQLYANLRTCQIQ